MKQFLPYNVLLAVTLAAVGAILLYNTVIRESYATTLRYAYPPVEQQGQAEIPAQEVFRKEPEASEVGESATEAEIGEPATEVEGELVTEALTEEPAGVEEEAVAGVQFPLDINTATLEEILLIPDVSNSVGQRIVQYRDHLGGAYSDLAELQNISGIGEATYERLWAYFTINGEEEGVTGVEFPLDINTATLEEILQIPDVGNSVAQRIVQYRDHLGGAYSDLAELQNISGVGEATYNKLWAYFTIGEDGEAYVE